MKTRYPQIWVRVRSSNPLAVISAVRSALRQAGVERTEIERFSRQAFTTHDLDELGSICRSWVSVEAPPLASSGSRMPHRPQPGTGGGG